MFKAITSKTQNLTQGRALVCKHWAWPWAPLCLSTIRLPPVSWRL